MKRRTFVKSSAVFGAALVLPCFSSLDSEAAADSDQGVKRVLAVFKCHFDAGFIDTQANVVHKYFTQYFPHAIDIARAQNASGKRRYVWTTGSWLLFEYLDQASPADRKAMEDAIARGDIAWHALPFTWQTELLSQSMIEGSLAFAQSLDRRFGTATTGAKMTDVPGHTRGLIAPLAKHGVTFLDIGVNDASTPAELPPMFLWKDAAGGTLPVMYHLGYGGVTQVPGSDLAVAIVVRGDNSGPHPPQEIDHIHDDLARHFPNAEITAANLSEVSNAVRPYRNALPIVTEEIGDTWIYGVPSDPLKVARYREVGRLREGWLALSKFRTGDATDLALLRHLLLETEHTWGTDTKTWLDFDNYRPADLEHMLETKNYQVVQFSWKEKRQDLLDGLATLREDLQLQAQHALDELSSRELKLPTRAKPSTAGEPIITSQFTLVVDPVTGAITRLRSNGNGREWAGPDHPIALLTYQALSKQDYDRFLKSYLMIHASWALQDLGKPNIDRIGAKSRSWQPALTALHREETPAAQRIFISLEFRDDAAFQSGLAAFPRKALIELFLPKAEPSIHITLVCFEKPATRLPEALWLSFNPIVEDEQGWMLEKSGQPVSPFDVATGGNRCMHALSRGFAYRHAGHSFAVDTLDAPVVALGERSPLAFSKAQPSLHAGIHSCLYNNAWGTNYVQWYGEDMRFRFVVRA